MITAEFIDKGTIEGLTAVAERVKRPRGMVAAVIRRGGNELKAHFLSRNSTPNKLGGRRTNFWLEIRSSVSTQVLNDTSGRIQVTDYRFNQKVYGGRISPKRKQALTVPVAPEAHGVTAAVFQQETGIQLFLLRKPGGGLTNLLAGAIGGSAHQFKVYYELEPYVDQAPDKQALPPPNEFNAALLDEGQGYLVREVIKKPGGATTP